MTAETHSSPPRRRTGRRWVIALVVIVVLLAAAAVAAEFIARSVVKNQIRELVVSQLALPAEQQVDVELDGIVIPQLITGALDAVTVSSDDVPLGPFGADVTVHATKVPVRGDAAAGNASAEVRLDESQLRALLGTLEGFPSDSVGIEAPDVTVSTQLNLFGAELPVGVALTPSAAEGELVLTPAAFTIGGDQFTSQGVRDRFGGFADPLLQQRSLCIAQYLPAALTLTSASVEGEQVIGTFAVDGRVVVDETLQQNGTCA